MEWETLTVYQASFFGYSFAAASEVLHPSNTISEVVIPFIFPPSGAPEVQVSPDSTAMYRNTSAMVLGNGTRLAQYVGDMFCWSSSVYS